MIAVIELVAWFVFLPLGLANGLASDNGATLENMDAAGLGFEQDVRLFLHRSILPETAVAEVAAVAGVRGAGPLGHLTLTVVRADGETRIGATMLGIDPTGFLAPTMTRGVPLAEANGGVVVDETFARDGVQLGDVLKVTPSGAPHTVVGFTSGEKYNHLPVIYIDVAQSRALKVATAAEAGGIVDPISAVVVQGDAGVLDAVRAALPDVDVATRQQTIENLPGYSSEMSTVRTILAFLFLIAAMVMAVSSM